LSGASSAARRFRLFPHQAEGDSQEAVRLRGVRVLPHGPFQVPDRGREETSAGIELPEEQIQARQRGVELDGTLQVSLRVVEETGAKVTGADLEEDGGSRAAASRRLFQKPPRPVHLLQIELHQAELDSRLQVMGPRA
jgi:hypothetical protein